MLLYKDYLEKNWSYLEKDEIIVINIKKLVNIDVKNEKYTQSKIDLHSNAKVWKVIIPALVKEFNL